MRKLGLYWSIMNVCMLTPLIKIIFLKTYCNNDKFYLIFRKELFGRPKFSLVNNWYHKLFESVIRNRSDKTIHR